MNADLKLAHNPPSGSKQFEKQWSQNPVSCLKELQLTLKIAEENYKQSQGAK